MFVTLFNLQGAHRSSAAGFYLTTLASLCQEPFLNFFRSLIRSSPWLIAAATVSHLTTSSSLCQVLFSTFFQNLFPYSTRPVARSLVLADSFDRLPLVLPFVKRFLESF